MCRDRQSSAKKARSHSSRKLTITRQFPICVYVPPVGTKRNVCACPISPNRQNMDGKGKAPPSVGRMWLDQLRVCGIRRTATAVRFQQKLNDINDPSAIRRDTGLKAIMWMAQTPLTSLEKSQSAPAWPSADNAITD